MVQFDSGANNFSLGCVFTAAIIGLEKRPQSYFAAYIASALLHVGETLSRHSGSQFRAMRLPTSVWLARCLCGPVARMRALLTALGL